MKTSRTRIALLALLCGTTLAHADILMLKNGTKVEGNILEQTEQGVRMKYRLTPKIMDEKLFPAAEIAQVIKQRPEEVEVVELRKVLPTPDLLKADEYEQIIQDRLRPFVNKYAGTPEAKEVEGLISSLQEEKTKVSNGQVKLEGRWLSVKESKGESFNLEAFRLLQAMRAAAAKQDWTAALREFDKFFATRPGYIGSSYFPIAIPEAIAILDKWEAALSKMASEQPQLLQQRKDGLAKLVEPELSKTKNAIDEEQNKWRTIMEMEKRQKIRWVTPYKYDLNTIQTAQKEVVAERTRLSTYNLEALKAQNSVFVACYRKIGEGDYTGGAAAFEKVQGMTVTTEFRDVTTDLRARLLKLYGELVRANTTAATATSGSAAIGGTMASQQDSRVAQILAEASGAKPAAAAPAATTAAPAATTAAPAPAPAAAAPAVVPATRPAVAPAPAPMPAPMPMPVMPVEEESNLQLYIMIGMGLVIVGLLVAFLKKK